MLGKTHKVMAPTGLLKVMESAVVEPGIRKGLNQNHHSMACLRGLYTHEVGRPGKLDSQGAPLQRPAGARLKAPAGPPCACRNDQHTTCMCADMVAGL